MAQEKTTKPLHTQALKTNQARVLVRQHVTSHVFAVAQQSTWRRFPRMIWEEKWHPAILKYAETQKATNKRVQKVLDDRSGIILIYIPMLHYLPSYMYVEYF